MNKPWLIGGTIVAFIASDFRGETCQRDADAVFLACPIESPEMLHTHDDHDPSAPPAVRSIVVSTVGSASDSVSWINDYGSSVSWTNWGGDTVWFRRG